MPVRRKAGARERNRQRVPDELCRGPIGSTAADISHLAGPSEILSSVLIEKFRSN